MARLAWEDVVESSAPGLYRLALMLTGAVPNAEDLLQSTFAKACRHGERIAAMPAPNAYLRTVMLNEHTSAHRTRTRRLMTVPMPDEVDLPASTTGQPVLEERDQVWRWLARLPRQQRAVLVLRFYEDLPDQEIADLVGCSRATVRSHASHGLEALRALLTDGSTQENR